MLDCQYMAPSMRDLEFRAAQTACGHFQPAGPPEHSHSGGSTFSTSPKLTATVPVSHIQINAPGLLRAGLRALAASRSITCYPHDVDKGLQASSKCTSVNFENFGAFCMSVEILSRNVVMSRCLRATWLWGQCHSWAQRSPQAFASGVDTNVMSVVRGVMLTRPGFEERLKTGSTLQELVKWLPPDLFRICLAQVGTEHHGRPKPP